MPGKSRCPQCSGCEIRKSRYKSSTERLLCALLMVRPMRCMECFRRFKRPFFYQAKPQYYGHRKHVAQRAA